MLRVALAVATTASAAVAAPPGGTSSDVPPNGFGGPVAVQLVHVGHIEIALGSRGTGGLRQVRCASPAAATTSCYIRR